MDGHGTRAWSIRRAALALATALLVTATGLAASGPGDRAAREAETERRLALVRREIAELSTARQALEGERSDAARTLREADQSVDQASRALREIDAQIAVQETELDRLQGERNTLETRLGTQREALARLLRSAYALGHNEQLKLLLAQDRLDALARVMAYHRYFQRDRVTRIDSLLAELAELAEVVRRINVQRDALTSSRELQTAQMAELETQRDERRALLASLETRFKDADSRLKALGRDEQALTALLEQLRDIFADIPDVEATVAFAKRRGQLSAPVPGKTLTAFGATLPDGRTSHGWLMDAPSGTGIRAIAHGRVAFADWLKGYGLIIILDHGEGWMSLYAQNDSLQRDVGEWVAAGDVLANAGSSGGQSQSALYFELRRNGQPVDPRGWFKPR